MQLALGHVARCEAELALLEERRPDHLTLNFTFRGAAVLGVKLLIRKGEYGAAALLAQSQIHEFAKVNDTSSLVALKTLRAVALGLVGDFAECSRALVDANHAGATDLREHQAEYAHACGLIWRHVAPTKSSPFESRSFRIWAVTRQQMRSATGDYSQRVRAIDDNSARQLINSTHPRSQS